MKLPTLSDCLRTWVDASWHPGTGGRGLYWSRDAADLSLESVSSEDNRTAEVLQRATPGEVVGRTLTPRDSCCVARCGSADPGCRVTHTPAHAHVFGATAATLVGPVIISHIHPERCSRWHSRRGKKRRGELKMNKIAWGVGGVTMNV